MAENNDFALVPKTPTALEKAEPGTKRILSGMVGDTLDLARKKASGEVTSADTQLENWFLTGLKYEIGQVHLKDCAEASDDELFAMLLGQDVPQDYTEAVKWYRKAAEGRHAEAQIKLAGCYSIGQGVAKNATEAVKWYRKAAEQNYIYAQFKLGWCYANGEGVTTDEVEAVKWFRKAAEQNHAGAQCNLGICYEYGLGVPEDFVEAYKFYKLAANNPSEANVLDEDQEKIAANLERIAARMTDVEIAEGERRFLKLQK
jgi:TPR repeat protein